MYIFFFILKKLLVFDFNNYLFKSFINISTIICTAFCITFIIISISINDSFKSKIINKIISLDGLFTIYRSDYDNLSNNDYDEISNAYKNNFLISKLANEQVLIKNGNISEGVNLRCIEFEQADVFNLNNIVFDGSIKKNHILIGEKLSKNLNIKINDEVFIISYINNNFKVINKKVSGIFVTNIPDYDKYVVYADINDFDDFFNYQNEYNSIVANEKENHNFDNINYKHNYEKYYTVDWSEKHSLFLGWLNSYDIPLKILLLLIILICIMNIFVSSYIDIQHRIEDLKLMSIIGLHAFRLRVIFIFKSLILGCIGFFSGFIISFILIILQSKFKLIKIPSEIYFMEYLPINIQYLDVLNLFLLFVLIIFIISFLIGGKISISPVKLEQNN